MNFVKNVGFVDQVVRALLILDIVAAYFMGFLSSLGAFILMLCAIALVGSCLTAYCPLYNLLGLSTRREYEDRQR